MAKISNTLSYPGQSPIEGADYLIGTAANSTPIGLQTKTFTIQGIADFIIDAAFDGTSYRLPIFTAASAGQESVLLVDSLLYQDTASLGGKLGEVLGTTVYLDNGSGVGSLEVAQNVLVKANLTVNNNANILNDFYVAGDSVFDDSVTMNQEIKLIGNVYDSTNTQGNQEQVLVSDGSGKVTWQNFQGSGLEYQSAWDASTNVPDLQAYPLTADNTGKYWVVSVPGTTPLTDSAGGTITDWEPGDWAIISEDIAGNVFWDKIDNSSILSGQGTTGNIAIWTAPRELGDAPIKIGAGTNSLIFNNALSSDGEEANSLGKNSTATGNQSFSVGYATEANSDYSFAAGFESRSNGTASVAMGNSTTADGKFSTALGDTSISTGESSFAVGKQAKSTADFSLAFGDSSESIGQHSFAGGKDSIASQQASFAFGENSFAQGQGSISIGTDVTAKGNSSIALGKNSTAETDSSIVIGLTNVAGSVGNGGAVAIGDGNNALGAKSVAIGENNSVAATASTAVALGGGNTANGDFSFSVGKSNQVEGGSGVAIGRDNIVKQTAINGVALGYLNNVESQSAAAIGEDNDAVGAYSMTFGYKNNAAGNYGVAIGQENTASGLNGTAIGKSNTASSGSAVALGLGTTASGSASIALNNSTVASGGDSFASGFESTATGSAGTAMGYRTSALGDYAFASGYLSNTNGEGAIAMGRNSLADNVDAVTIGNNIISAERGSIGLGNNLLVKGQESAQIGSGLEGNSFREIILGSFNTTVASTPDAWVGTETLLTIGNGQDVNNRSDALVLNKDGELKLPSYGGGTITGTATYNLGVDVNGNVIEVSTGGGGGGTVTGNGTQDYITKWNSNTAVGDSIMFEGGQGIGLGTVTPSYSFDTHYGSGRYASFGIAFAEAQVANSIINIGDVDGNAAALGLYDESSTRAVLVKGGSVRIGSGGAATEKLEVEGNIALSSSASQDDVYSTNDALFLSAGGNSVSSTSILIQDANGVISTDANSVMGVGVSNPQAKLDVNGGIKMGDTNVTPSAANVGTMRYRVSGNNSYVDMIMQDGATSYTWVNIVQKNW